MMFHTHVQVGELPIPLRLLTSVAEGAPSWTWNSAEASGTGLVDLQCGCVPCVPISSCQHLSTEGEPLWCKQAP